ncbi:MAG: TolC family protein [Deltaproteobacteria bacterium]|nr:TolC family protein [Deltaproteobacteria bacterium]
MRIAVRQNLDVVLERRAVEVTKLAGDIAAGGFEPTISAGYNHSDVLSPPASAQEGGADEIFNAVDDAWRISIDQRLHSATQLSLDFNSGRAKSSLGTAVQPLNYRSVLSLSVIQPLARGFSTDLAIPKLEILRATIANERERQQLTITITALVDRTETAYWNVLQTLYRYDLAQRSQKAADDQLLLTNRQITAGNLPSSDRIGAESTVAQRRLELVDAEQSIQAAFDGLRAVMNLPRPEWARAILPTDVPRFAPIASSADAAIELAIKHRPELAQAGLDLKVSDLTARKADNDRLPQLDLGLSGQLFGQAATYGGALSQLSSADARGWAVFANLTWAPLRRATTAAAEIAKIQQQQTQLRRDQLVQAVWIEVRDAVRNQQGAERRLVAAARFRDLAEKSLEIEQRRFIAGESSNIVVAQRQDALAAARLAELDALLGHRRAATTLLKATGRLLEERRIELK